MKRSSGSEVLVSAYKAHNSGDMILEIGSEGDVVVVMCKSGRIK